MITLVAAAQARDAACALWSSQALRVLPSTCQRGCPHCCRQFVGCQPWEARWFALHAPADVLQGFVDQAPIQRAVLAGHNDQINAEMCRDWLSRSITCPAWSPEEACRAYDYRPASCRSFWSLSPPEECAASSMKPTVMIDPVEPLVYVQQLQQQLGTRPAWVPFVIAVAEMVKRARIDAPTR